MKDQDREEGGLSPGARGLQFQPGRPVRASPTEKVRSEQELEE